MQLSAVESKFLTAIKNACQLEMKNNKILSSVTAAQAIHESNLGQKEYVKDTNNIFRVLIDSGWNGQCYSLEKKQLYISVEDADSTDTLIKVYDSYDQCIHDWIGCIISMRKSKNGPFKYKQVVGIKDYKKCIKAYIRCGYIKDHLCGYDDPSYESNLISFIENYKLMDWDKEVENGELAISVEKYDVKKDVSDTSTLLSTTVLQNAKFMAKNNRGYKVFSGTNLINDPWDVSEDVPLYRVRLSWDNIESQLIVTRFIDDAMQEASAHPGYKVYIGENGELYANPWDIKEEENEEPVSKIVSANLLQVGMPIALINTPVYKTATAKNPFVFVSGVYYIYDAKNINGRARISKTNDMSVINGKKLSAITGFIYI